MFDYSRKPVKWQVGNFSLLFVICYFWGWCFGRPNNSSAKARNFATRSNRRLGCPNDEYRTTIDTRFYIYRAI